MKQEISMRHNNPVTVIGGGIGGLTTALLLSQRGYAVQVLESSAHWGGRLAFVEQDGDRIDAGPTIVLLPHDIRARLREGGIHDETVTIHRCDPMMAYHYPDGQRLTKYAEAQAMRQELERFSVGEGRAFEQYMADMAERYAWGKKTFLEQIFLNTSLKWGAKAAWHVWRKGMFRTVRRHVEHYFHDERVRDAFSLQSLYIGGNPWTAPALYALVGYAEQAYGVGYVQGGYASLVQHLVQTLQQRGVTMACGQRVSAIALDARQRVQAVCVGQETYATDAVVYNGDFPHLHALMHGAGKSKGPERPKRKYTASSGCLLLYIGVQGRYLERTMHEFWMGDDLQRHMDDIFVSRTLPRNPSFYTFYPSVVDTTLTKNPTDSVLYVLVPMPSGEAVSWEKVHDEWVGWLLDQLEQRAFPQLRQRIRWLRVRTPQEAQAQGLFEGGSFGLAPTWGQSAMMRPQLKPFAQIEGLYAVGASVHPGGGIPIVMQGAKMLVDRWFPAT